MLDAVEAFTTRMRRVARNGDDTCRKAHYRDDDVRAQRLW